MKVSLSRNNREGWYSGRTRGHEHDFKYTESWEIMCGIRIKVKRHHKRYVRTGFSLRDSLPF